MMATPLHTSLDSTMLLLDPPDEGVTGARMLGFEPMPVQVEMWLLLNAVTEDDLPLHENAAIEIVRRVGKTGGLLALALGRCEARPGYQVVYCAQSGIKSRRRFWEVVRLLLRHHPDGWRYRARASEECIEFENGSTLWFSPPKASSFRGDAIDWLILDEAQEVDEEDAADLIGSVMPTFDTRPEAQLTVAGTAGGHRSGLLWEALEKGRSGEWAILEYAAPDGTEDISDEALWLSVHPGPAGAAGDQERTLALLRKRFANMDPEMFAREYLGIWPVDVTAGAFVQEVWQRLGRTKADQPARVGIGFDVRPGARHASVAVAWRDEAGYAWVEIALENDPVGIGALVRRFKVPVGYDPFGVDTANMADEIARRHRHVTLRPVTTLEYATSCVTLDREVREGTLRHMFQPQLDGAVEVASRRPIRDAGWGWGRKGSDGDISALVAATIALRMFDDLPVPRGVPLVARVRASA